MSHPFSPEELTAIRREDRAITDDAEIAELLRQADVCRIATSVTDQPFISANTFWYDDQPNRGGHPRHPPNTRPTLSRRRGPAVSRARSG